MGLRKAHGRQTDVLFVVLFPPALLRLFDLRQLSMGVQGVPNSVSLRDCDDTRWYLQMVGQNQNSWFLLANTGNKESFAHILAMGCADTALLDVGLKTGLVIVVNWKGNWYIRRRLLFVFWGCFSGQER